MWVACWFFGSSLFWVWVLDGTGLRCCIDLGWFLRLFGWVVVYCGFRFSGFCLLLAVDLFLELVVGLVPWCCF